MAGRVLEVKKTYVPTPENFHEHIVKVLFGAKANLEENGEHSTTLLISKGDTTYGYWLPDDQQEQQTVLAEIKEEFEGKIDYYIFLIELWSVKVPEQEQEKYSRDPTLIVENPFKEESLGFEIQGFGQTYLGRIPFERDDTGNVITGDIDWEANHDPIVVGALYDMVK